MVLSKNNEITKKLILVKFLAEILEEIHTN